jgi:hypothetical protein
MLVTRLADWQQVKWNVWKPGAASKLCGQRSTARQCCAAVVPPGQIDDENAQDQYEPLSQIHERSRGLLVDD